jgi:ribosomal protein L11 methyltransferase
VTRGRIISPAEASLWRLALVVASERLADIAAAALETCAVAVSIFELEPGVLWRVEAIAQSAPDRVALAGAGALAALALDIGADDLFRDLVVERLAPRDWVGENQASFPPLRIGRFFIHGSHVAGVPSAGAIALRIDAATAFGTGEHATTRGCLLALGALAKRRRFRRPLDMGTGTGILAMAAARLWGCCVVACDLDAGAVAVTRTNSSANRLARRIRIHRANGYRHPAVRRGRPFDLILANILARPLQRMAGDLAAHLAPGGIAVLSGLLPRQAQYVLAAHRARGLSLVRRIAVDGWTTLVLELRRREARDRSS